MSKRPRTASKPNPTPDPPASLVNLLQSDSAVLEYFSALQANIDFDVQVWKKEALEGRKEIIRLTKLLSSRSPIPAKKNVPLEQKGAIVEFKESTPKLLKRRGDYTQVKTTNPQHILDDENDTDFLKDLENEFNTTNDFDSTVAVSTILEVPRTIEKSTTEYDSTSVHNEWILKILADLDECLKQLGVNLVRKQGVSHGSRTVTYNDSHSSLALKLPALDKEPKGTQFLVQRSDVDVCTDILRALRLSIRAPVRNKLYPFSSLNFYPCYLESKEDPHPAFTCIELICRLLFGLEFFTHSYFGNKAIWDVHRSCDIDRTIYDSLLVGLKGRNLPELILSSLEGEMCNQWCVADRHLIEKTAVPKSEGEAYTTPADDRSEYGPVNVTVASLQGRLFQLSERASIARIISFIHQSHRDYQRGAINVINYVIHHTPIIDAENYVLGPCMSLCTVEALLTEVQNEILSRQNTSSDSWFSCFLSRINPLNTKNQYAVGTILGESLATSILVSAHVYMSRSSHDDVKKRGISAVELAAYNRLCLKESWLLDPTKHAPSRETSSSKIQEILNIVYSEDGLEKFVTRALSTALMIYLIILGDLSKTHEIMKELFTRINRSLQPQLYFDCIVSCCKAYVLVDKYLLYEPSTVSFVREFHPSEYLRKYVDEIPKVDDLKLHLSIIQCCIFLSDGNLATQMLEYMLNSRCLIDDNDSTVSFYLNELLELGVKYPHVRVINLARRFDRLRNFFHQASHEKILVMLAVSPLVYDDDLLVERHKLFHGTHAFDGQGSHVDFERNVVSDIGPEFKLSSYVSTHWRPSDLKAFDSYARCDDNLVRMSPSERACALSHIGSWIGVERSLEILENGNTQREEVKLSIAKLFQVSGFASGPALLPENANIPPSSVVVIMEDDAMLVDRFTDRLQLLLRELPRDFHFCSLGYGR
jgi:hypothetical protein